MGSGNILYVLRLGGLKLLLLLLVSIAGFVLLHLAPGDPLSQFTLAPGMTAERLAQIAHGMGLDQPLWRQYLHWLYGIMTGDWGRSFRDQAPVLGIIVSHLAATVELGLAALTISFTLGVGMGLLGALRSGRVLDDVTSVVSIVLFSLPTFWLGLVFIYVFSVRLHWFPTGNVSSPGDRSVVGYLRHLALPALTLGLVSVPVWSRYMRTFAGEILKQDQIRTARALGLSSGRIIVHRLLRGALLPMIPVAGIYLPTLLSGALVTETVFSWPGIGRLFLDSLQYRDYPVVMGVLMFSAILVLLSSTLAELVHHAADPRLRA
ncbi:ABC transporter permease [Gluconobacter albidus]|uniref:ABC transporter permease n=1 Tax=Gluconobacter albidus TaxID=318683 RepID=UPI0030A58EEA